MSHHIFCNHSGPAESCRQCESLFKDFPYETQDTEKDIVFKYFPEAVSSNSKQAAMDYLKRSGKE